MDKLNIATLVELFAHHRMRCRDATEMHVSAKDRTEQLRIADIKLKSKLDALGLGQYVDFTNHGQDDVT